MGPPEGRGLTVALLFPFLFFVCFFGSVRWRGVGRGEKRTGLKLWGVWAPLGCRAAVTMEGSLAAWPAQATAPPCPEFGAC